MQAMAPFPVRNLGSHLLAWAAAVLLVLTAVGGALQRSERRVNWRHILEHPDDWYGSDEAVRIADNVLVYQHPNGGWEKNTDKSRC